MLYSYASQRRDEISATFQIEQQIANLTSLVQNLATSMSNAQQDVEYILWLVIYPRCAQII